MATRVKHAILKCITESVSSKSCLEGVGRTKSKIELQRGSQNKLLGNVQFLPDDAVNLDFDEINSNKDKIIEAGAAKQINITDVNNRMLNISFSVDLKNFIKDVLSNCPTDLYHLPEKRKIVVEFSSPNIAKEFHVGHLRSTVTGNFIAKLKKKLGHNVVTMNFLGDWGTQFGLLIVGMNHLGLTDESLSSNAVQKLTEAYIYANRMAFKDEGINAKARELVKKLENGDKELLDLWMKIKKFSETDLNLSYERLNISFDEFQWESSYNKTRAEPFLQNLEARGLLTEDGIGRKIVKFGDLEIPLLKSDGSTLYLLRDVVAYFDRRSRHNFDDIYYVVDSGQGMHFKNLKTICEEIEPNSSACIHHVKFGRIGNMSTRKGTNVLLQNVLDEAKSRMFQKILASETTKGTPSEETADVIGTGAIILNILRRSRKTEYSFEWESALKLTGLTGVQLQYSHCRLCSLKENSGKTVANECDPDVLLEPEAVQLVLDISNYEEALREADNELESFHLVNYLFGLMKSNNKAFKLLPVKHAAEHLGSQRLLLFDSARKVFKEALSLLGVTVVDRM